MTVVITGASRGFGLSIAEAFASAGHDLLLCAMDQQRLDASTKVLAKKFPSITIASFAVNLAVKQEAVAFGKWALRITDKVDVLVNNAGTFLPGNVGDEPEGTLEQLIAVNLYGAYHLTRTLLPRMKEQGSGHIFNMCSIASLHAYKNGGSYSISKFALAGFSKNLREELKEFNIKVTAVYPGAAFTDSWAGSGVDPKRIMESTDIATLIEASTRLSPQACVEDIILRPQLGDI